MSGCVYWWTCHHLGCLDRMAASPDPEQVRRDQRAHIATHHDSYQYSDAELRLSSWPLADKPSRPLSVEQRVPASRRVS